MALLTMGGTAVLLSLQLAQAVIVGTVRNDATGAPLADAIVAMTDVSRQARVDSTGRYVFPQVAPGPHHLVVRAFGFAPRTVHAFVPTDGVLEINVSLVPVKLRLPTLYAQSAPSVRESGDRHSPSATDRHATIVAVRNNPMLIEPDLLLAISGGTVVAQPEAPRGLHIRGGASDHVTYLLDGIPVFSPYHTAGVFSAWNPDAMSAVTLSSSMPNPGDLASLSGTVTAATRTPSERVQAQGSMSSLQVRVTIDGPLGSTGATMLLSLGEGLPGAIIPRHEQSYVRGESGDRLGKLEAPLFGGRLRLLGFESVNEITTPSIVSDAPPTIEEPRRNAFRWRSHSVGAEWTSAPGGRELRVIAWRATGSAGTVWGVSPELLSMESSRADAGMLAAARRSTSRSTTVIGARIEQSRTSYVARRRPDDPPPLQLAALTLTTTAFAQHEYVMSQRTTLNTDLSLSAFRGRVFAGPRAQWQWKATDRVALSGSFARLHQFAQSLRNQESITGAVFPAELFIGAGGPQIPVARSEQGVLAAAYQGSRGVRLSAEAFTRQMRGLVLVAANSAEPFASRLPAIGNGTSRGVGVDASMNRSRYGIVASYGMQRVRYASAHMSYVPEHGALHTFDGGITIFPATSFSVRLGVTGALGRRSAAVVGPFEWEACNLKDRGCEFGGSPRTSVQSLGRSTLPGYLRADLGVRKHWHTQLRGRDVVVALFGAASNVTDRRNVLTYANDPLSDAPGAVQMRPRAPLVVGIDWQF